MSGVPVMARRPRTPRTILVLGGGAREDALAWRLARDPGVERIVVAPGNPGMTPAAELRPGLDLADAAAVADLAREVAAELVLVGPESPLVGGVADALRAAGLAVFGPSAAAARLEGSKSFCRAVAAAAGVPMAEGAAFTSVGPALEFAERLDGRVVVKADGLAAGKGVTVCADVEEAEDALRASLEGGRFGPAGLRVVVEARLEGPEASLIALCDETAALALPAARDHKRVGDGERGPNTGGMGAYSPVPDLDDASVAELIERIHRPVLAELARRGVAFRGALYAGLILAAEGVRLLEFNVRFGDPEAQALLPRLEGPLAPLLLAAAEGRLAEAATGLGVFIGPAVAFFWPSKLEEVPSEPVAVGPASSIKAGESVTIRYGRYPALVINTPDGIRAYSAVCTHFACLVKWNPATGRIECPCHAGFFAANDGAVISGPPPKPLTPIAVSLKDNTLFIGSKA